jgi:pimeloyl-ACP methyl ester carboxylesterase
MRKLRKGIFWTLVVVAGLLATATAVFYRGDIALETLAETYETEASFYADIAFLTASGETEEVTIHAMSWGDAGDPAVVLLHGMFSSSHTFIPWAERLAAEGYYVLAVDLPGFGLSEVYPDKLTSQRRHAAVLKELLDQLSIDEAFVGGNSMGGGVAWYFASEYHAAGFVVKGVILIDAVYPGMTGEDEDGGLRALLSSPVGVFLSNLTPRFLFKSILKVAYGSDAGINEADVDRYYLLLRGEGHREAIVSQTTEVDPEGSPTGMERLLRLKDESIPTLVMWGKQDSWIPVATADLFAQTLELPASNVIVYDALGHVPMEEDPQGTVEDVLIFLDAVLGGS